MSYDPNQIASAGPLGPGVEAKSAALATWLAQVLALHAAATDARAWAVARYADPRLSVASIGAQTRAAVMGSPARYAEVIWSGVQDGYDPTAEATVFDVGLYFGVSASVADSAYPTLIESGETAFRSVCDRPDLARPGVLVAARRQDTITTSGTNPRCALGDPTGVSAGRLAPTGRGDEYTLALSFSITVS